ncbi:hypothetical protein PN4B1_16670 [Paenibacillus naphthalenovorans]|uniref:hypothetical protein n=1 Tax=Paenibacillus naphthalenovorans TaxID=162209 RepID=UPI0010B9A288|nr:hypothetical protein [Paenibacillus naphthalenovorans]GCL71762.1 hypothetical protein PN4B1_16670 [Paenibacillus naphthalenovorans]
MNIINDADVMKAIEVLKAKGITFEQIKQVYEHWFYNLPVPGTQVKWKATGSVKTVQENFSNMYTVEQGYIRIRNDVGTDLFLSPHEYEVLPNAPDTTE